VQALMEYKRLHGRVSSARSTAEPSPENARALRGDPDVREQRSRPACRAQSTAGKNTAGPRRRRKKRGHRRVGVIPFVPIPRRSAIIWRSRSPRKSPPRWRAFRWFDVVAPTALMRGLAPTFLSDVELRRQDLDYVIDGSVSCSRGMYRINVRLLDLTTDATPVWNSTFDLPTDRLDLLTSRSPRRSSPRSIRSSRTSRDSRRSAAADDDALGCVMRALPLVNMMERTSYEEAGRLIDRALALEPENAVGALVGRLLARLLCRTGLERRS
jgi:hypothetical protein